jgi:hypothetical protein
MKAQAIITQENLINNACCDDPDLIKQKGEIFCKNCGLVIGSNVIKLNQRNISVDSIIEKRMATMISNDWSKRLKMNPIVPYNTLTHFNRKYGIGIWNFSLPRITCKWKTTLCDKFCYGKKYAFCYKHVKQRFKQNLKMTMLNKFSFLAISQIHRLNIKYVRIHTIGDFYSQAYFNKWVEIANQCPEVTILAYTRNWEIDTSKAPSNFIIYYSVDFSTKHFNPTISRLAITFKAPPETKMYKHLEDIPGAKVCSSRCQHCKFCWSGVNNVAFPISLGRRSYKPEFERIPYQLSDDETGKISKRKKKSEVKVGRPRIKTPKDFEIKLLETIVSKPLERTVIASKFEMSRSTVFDHLVKCMNSGYITTQKEKKVLEMGKEGRGRPKTLFSITQVGLDYVNKNKVNLNVNSS